MNNLTRWKNWLTSQGVLSAAAPPPAPRNWGGARPGAGRPKVHTQLTVKPRIKALRATDQEWAEFMRRIQNNTFQGSTRDHFNYLLDLVMMDTIDKIDR